MARTDAPDAMRPAIFASRASIASWRLMRRGRPMVVVMRAADGDRWALPDARLGAFVDERVEATARLHFGQDSEVASRPWTKTNRVSERLNHAL
jgi:hypothetical protein